MKIAYIGQKGIPMTQGGIEAHVENLAVEMAKRGHEVYVYARPNYTDKNLKEYKGVHIINLPSISTKHFDAISHTFISSIHACFQNYDIIHYHGVGPSLMSFIPRIFSRAKVIGTFHCMDRFHQKWNRIAKSFLLLGEYTVCKFPHKTIAVSPIIKDYAKKHFKKEIVEISNGFSVTKNQNTDKLEELNIKPKKYFLAISRIIAHKGLQYLIEAFNKLENNEYQLVIVGDTFHNAEYSEYIKKLSDSNKNIILTGQQQGEALNQIFTHAFCFVIPSEGEGLSITLLEAMAHGLPTIASIIDGNQCFIDKDLVYSFENKNVNELQNRMQYIISNQQQAIEKAKNTEKYIREHYSWDVVANEIEKLYKSF